MKAFNKRVRKRKASKITLKVHRKGVHPNNGHTNDPSGMRPEDVKFLQ